MGNILFFDDLSIGDRWVSERRVVTEADVFQFAHLTGDNDPLHIDEEFAQRTPFRKRIAHGMLGLSLLAGASSTNPRVETVALVEIRDWSFREPIFFDDVLHVVTSVMTLEGNGRRRGKVTWHRQLVNQDGRVVQEGVLVTLVTCRAASVRQTFADGTHATVGMPTDS